MMTTFHRKMKFESELNAVSQWKINFGDIKLDLAKKVGEKYTSNSLLDYIWGQYLES